MDKNCDNCMYSGRPSYDFPCTACTTAYGSDPSKWEGMVPATADMVEVVRCKDCKYYRYGISHVCELHSEEPDQFGTGFEMQMFPHDFCSYGERKDNEC